MPNVKETILEARPSIKEQPVSFPATDKTARHPAASWRAITQVATIGTFFIAFVTALSLARGVLLPVLAAFVIGAMLTPLAARADQYRVPPALSALLLVLGTIAVFNLVILMISSPVVDWIGKAPQIAQSIKEKLHVLDGPIAALQNLRDAVLPPENTSAELRLDLKDVVQPLFAVLTPAIGSLVVFFGTLYFFLFGRIELRRVLVAFFGERDMRLLALRILNDVEHNLVSYLTIVSAINFVVGLVAAGIAWLVGLPNPIAWGMVGFLFNYIPYLGPLIVELGMFCVGLVTFPTVGQALIAPACFMVFATLEGHFVTPSIVGLTLTLNPLLVFLALVFWTWLWGPVGAFLAVPLLIVALVIMSHMFPADEPTLPH
jgi:predicted PurR-regulated permease PerM